MLSRRKGVGPPRTFKRVRANNTISRMKPFSSNNLEDEPIFFQAKNKFFTVAFLEIDADSKNIIMTVPAISKSTSSRKLKTIGGAAYAAAYAAAEERVSDSVIGELKKFFFIKNISGEPQRSMDDLEIVEQLGLGKDIQAEDYINLLTDNVKGQQYTRKKRSNKGEFGSRIEKMCRLIPDSKLCDFMTRSGATPMTGDAKGLTVSSESFKTMGSLIPKDTTKVTMIKRSVLDMIRDNNLPVPHPLVMWENSFIYKKIQNIIFIPYIRDSAPSKKRPGKDSPDKGETATFLEPIVVSAETHPKVYAKLEEDFYDIIRKYKDGRDRTITGKHNMLQIRTAGSGKKKEKNYAFYLTKSCTNELLKRGVKRHSLYSVAASIRKPALSNTSAASMSAASMSAANMSAANTSAANTSAANMSAANTSAANMSAANTSAANKPGKTAKGTKKRRRKGRRRKRKR